VEILREHTLPAVGELAASREQALPLGEATIAESLEARASQRAVERELVAAEAAWVWARVQAWLYYEAVLDEERSE
jgi:hypothetical protein